jgi:2'-5' RNA ligase
VNDDTFVPRRSAKPLTAVLGIVIAVPEPWAQLLVEWRAKVGDPQASVVPPHVTLLPPTEVSLADRPAISEHLTRVAAAHPPFAMHLAGTGTFSPVSDVVFVAVARGIGNCELLSNDVRQGPLARDLGFADLSVEFDVDHLTEFEQTTGGAWVVSREYPLTGDGSDEPTTGR